MERILIVIDMQNDFITGSLGTEEAAAVVPRVREYVERWLEEKQGEVFFPETRITVVAGCCARVTAESHERALKAMEACQVHVLRERENEL